MADTSTELNPGSGGDFMDEEAVAFGGAPTTRKRPRVVIGGAIAAALAAVQNILPRLADYGLTVRLAGNRSETAAHSSVASSATSVTLLAANAAGRIGASVYNNGTSTIFISVNGAASTSNAGVAVGPGGYWECPYGFSGDIFGIWLVANGTALVTEYT